MSFHDQSQESSYDDYFKPTRYYWLVNRKKPKKPNWGFTRQKLRGKRLKNLEAFARLLRERCDKAYEQGFEDAWPAAVKAALRSEELLQQQLIRRDKRRKMEIEANKAVASAVDLSCPESVAVDLLRDISWVYVNLGRLFVVMSDGVTRKIDNDVLKEAPSPGAKAFAQYALEDIKAFFDRYVTLLLKYQIDSTRGQLKVTEADDTSLDAENADPSLEALSKFLKPKGE